MRQFFCILTASNFFLSANSASAAVFGGSGGSRPKASIAGVIGGGGGVRPMSAIGGSTGGGARPTAMTGASGGVKPTAK